MSEIDAIVFDVGRVIVHWDIRHLFKQLIDEPEELEWFLANVVTEEWHFEHDAGRPLSEMVPERQRMFPGHAHLIEAYANRFLDTIPGPVEGTAALIEQLAAAGHPLFAITNFGSEFWQEFYPTCEVLARFSDIVVSGDEKLVKPDPAIFRLAEQRFGYQPHRMLFIDDNSANIAAARALEWQVHLFRDAPTLQADLVARNLIPE